jgi:ribosomal-protein-alanine N-acetyltransferase
MWKRFSQYFRKWFPEPIVFRERTITVRGTRFSLRPMLMQDVATALEIEKAIYGNTPWDRFAFLSELQKRGRTVYLVCTELTSGAIVGYVGAYFREQRAHVTIIAVAPTWQRRGLGRMLMETMIGQAHLMGCTYMTLEVAVDNLGAQRLYHSLGFANGRIRKNYYTNEHTDAMDMKLLFADQTSTDEESL